MNPTAPMRIFIASGCPIVTTTLYRCTHLQEQLQLLGHHADIVEWFDDAAIDPAQSAGYDLVVLYRLPLGSQLQAVIDQARGAGVPVLFDTDDLVFEPELLHWHRAVQKLIPADQQQHARGVQRYQDTLLACDAALVATDLLADLARKRGNRAFVHRNALGGEMVRAADELRGAKRDDRSNVVIGYGSGTATHDVDFREAAAALARVLNDFSQTELWIAGPLELPENLAPFAARIRRFPLTDWRGWFELLSQVDIAIAPLEADNIFCRAKSEIKWIEAAVLGVPVVASAIDPYQHAIAHGDDGFLAATESDWTECLSDLICDRAKRERVGNAARAKALAAYTPKIRAQQLAAILTDIARPIVK